MITITYSPQTIEDFLTAVDAVKGRQDVVSIPPERKRFKRTAEEIALGLTAEQARERRGERVETESADDEPPVYEGMPRSPEELDNSLYDSQD